MPAGEEETGARGKVYSDMKNTNIRKAPVAVRRALMRFCHLFAGVHAAAGMPARRFAFLVAIFFAVAVFRFATILKELRAVGADADGDFAATAGIAGFGVAGSGAAGLTGSVRRR